MCESGCAVEDLGESLGRINQRVKENADLELSN
jgi:uncharacterized protein YoxC